MSNTFYNSQGKPVNTDFTRKYALAKDEIERKILLNKEIARICKFLKHKPPIGITLKSAVYTLTNKYNELEEKETAKKRIDAAKKEIRKIYK